MSKYKFNQFKTYTTPTSRQFRKATGLRFDASGQWEKEQPAIRACAFIPISECKIKKSDGIEYILMPPHPDQPANELYTFGIPKNAWYIINSTHRITNETASCIIYCDNEYFNKHVKAMTLSANEWQSLEGLRFPNDQILKPKAKDN